MIIFLQPGEQVEVQFIETGSIHQPASMKTFNGAVVVKHETASHVKVGTSHNNNRVVEVFNVDLQSDS